MDLKNFIDNYKEYKEIYKKRLYLTKMIKRYYYSEKINGFMIKIGLFLSFISGLGVYNFLSNGFSITGRDVGSLMIFFCGIMLTFLFIKLFNIYKIHKIKNKHPLFSYISNMDIMLDGKRNDIINKKLYLEFNTQDYNKVQELIDLNDIIKSYKIKQQLKDITGKEKEQALLRLQKNYENKTFSIFEISIYLLDIINNKEFIKIDNNNLKSFLKEFTIEEQTQLSEKLRNKINQKKSIEEKEKENLAFIDSLGNKNIDLKNRIIKEL